MRLLVVEDLGSRELMRRLDKVLPGESLAPEREMSDEAVWTQAQRHAAAILTANVVDFLGLAAERPDHNDCSSSTGSKTRPKTCQPPTVRLGSPRSWPATRTDSAQ